MYKLSKETIKSIEGTLGLSYDEILNMDPEEMDRYIEEKNGRKLGYRYDVIRSSGDDSVLISLGRMKTMEEINEKIEKTKTSKKKDKKVLELD